MNKPATGEIGNLLKQTSLVRAVSEVVAAVVNYDGVFSMAEYAVTAEISKGLSRIGDNRLLANAILTDCLLDPPGLDDALSHLSSYAKALDEGQRQALRQLVEPLVETQGAASEELMLKIARCLDVSSVTGSLLFQASSVTRKGLAVFSASKSSKRSMGTAGEAVREAMLVYGYPDLAKHFAGDEETFTEVQLDVIRQWKKDMERSLVLLRDSSGSLERQAEAVAQVAAVSEALQRQVKQRLDFIQHRLTLSADHFVAEMEEFYDAVATSFSADLKDLVAVSDHTSGDIWEVLNKASAGQRMRSRYDRLRERMTENMKLWKEELEAFSGELHDVNMAVLQSLDKIEFESLIPARSLGFKLAGTADVVADRTVDTAIFTALSTSALVGLNIVKWTTVVGLLGGTGGLVALGVVGMSAGYQMFRNVRSRVNKEIRTQQEKLIAALKKTLGNPEIAYMQECEALATRFFEAAERELSPVVLEAALARHYRDQQKQLLSKLSTTTEQHLRSVGGKQLSSLSI
ncbi:hypothetical protein [Microbulbifer sp.]|uniref:hypothetical protein n=1 Tax=Microbulbifer sp. TaxID=1908541 RepID=UPI00258E2DB4|nr:hypothetical protein [Microbulbifer sp.]